MNESISPFNVTADDYSHGLTGPVMAAPVINDFKRELRRFIDSDQVKLEWETTPWTYTIKQAAEMTGLPRHVIYKKICDGRIQARMAPIGAPRWLLSATEVEKLMPAPSGVEDTPGPFEAPNVN
jgi:excisionase family DNA binding protein